MEVIYGLIPGMLILGLVAVGVLFWAARSGQFDDLEGDAHRILMDDDGELDRRCFPDVDGKPKGQSELPFEDEAAKSDNARKEANDEHRSDSEGPAGGTGYRL